ncbi:hypothetical protein ACFQO1_03695 [Jejudonia soesokkakensis]|uniref:Anti-sigma factor n=1 Tax=Jejudonia soesokkakensis TaxID=1323432 RepID=A0ABW2MTZ4_9FLAO
MAPIKLEEHIREKLQEREIQPSQTAWSKLEGQLGESDRKSPFLWYAIAASFIGIIIVASFVFTKDKSATDFVIENTTEKIDAEKPSEIIKNKNVEKRMTTIPSENLAVEPIDKKKEETLATQKVIKEKQIFQQKETPKQPIAIAETKNEEKALEVKEVNSVFINDKLIEKSKVEEVVAQINSIQKTNNTVTTQEIDALLLNAQRELQTQRILNNSKVDAAALLEDIEFEMERSFRDKVFDALGQGFNKVRTAVSDRNN